MTPWEIWAWPWSATMEMWRRALEMSAPASAFAPATATPSREEAEWTTPNREVVQLAALTLRDFSNGESRQRPILIVTPFTLHDATLADLAPGHSLIETLRGCGCARLFLVEWKSATAETKLDMIDSQLSALNVAIDELGSEASLVGLCQGGWLSLVYALRFPAKVRRLVLAGAPIDIDAELSALSGPATSLSSLFVEELIRRGDGLVLGEHNAALWPHNVDEKTRMNDALQLESSPDKEENRQIVEIFKRWDRRTLDLPGPYYRQVFEWFYRENRLAAGTFIALGRRIHLKELRCPLFLLAGEQDVIAPPAQVFAAASLVGANADKIETALASSSHLGLFVGKRTLTEIWPRIATWLLR